VAPTTGTSHYFYVWINGKDLLQNREPRFSSSAERLKIGKSWISLSFLKIIVRKDFIVQIRCADADPQIADTNSFPSVERAL
jgi:hypothetical protein